LNANQAIQQAIDAIGAQERTDYIISPTTHAEQFRAKVPELATILDSSRVSISASQYETADAEALNAQEKFKRASNRANLMVFITTILTGLVLAVGTLAPYLPDPLERALLVLLGLATAGCGGIATKYLMEIRSGKLLEAWMSMRAIAESYRLAYFVAVVTSQAAGASATQAGVLVDLLKFEYFRRFQLDVQLAYYRKRGQDHRAEASKTLSYGSLAVAGAAAATVIAGVLSGLNTQFAAIAAFGTVFAGLSSFAAIREATNQDRRNGERYARTARALEDLAKRLDEVRNSIYASGDKALQKFVEAVNEQLSLEHRQWLAEQSLAQGAAAELDKILKDAAAAPAPPKPGG
jgi:hypothetical protein